MTVIGTEKVIDYLKKFIANAPPGVRIVYWRGHLARDRLRLEISDGRIISRNIDPADRVARLFWQAHEQGKVELTQERDGGKTNYIATKRRNR